LDKSKLDIVKIFFYIGSLLQRSITFDLILRCLSLSSEPSCFGDFFKPSPIHKGSALRLIKTIESKKASQGQFLVY